MLILPNFTQKRLLFYSLAWHLEEEYSPLVSCVSDGAGETHESVISVQLWLVYRCGPGRSLGLDSSFLLSALGGQHWTGGAWLRSQNSWEQM